jgi:hypothetical protein
MTGFESKRQAAQDKLDEDDMLTIVYAQGFADGKRSAQRKPLTDKELRQIFRESSRYDGDDFQAFARAIEQAHNIKEQP